LKILRDIADIDNLGELSRMILSSKNAMLDFFNARIELGFGEAMATTVGPK
jgi:hypothetical protein